MGNENSKRIGGQSRDMGKKSGNDSRNNFRRNSSRDASRDPSKDSSTSSNRNSSTNSSINRFEYANNNTGRQNRTENVKYKNQPSGAGYEARNRTNGRFDRNDDSSAFSGREVVRLPAEVDKQDDFETGFSEEEDRGIIEGRNPVLEALRAGRPINKILLLKGEREGTIRLIAGIAEKKGILFQEVERDRLDAVSMTRLHQGVIAFAAAKEYVEPEEMLQIAKDKGEEPFIIILDSITDENNLGAIIRTADAAGVHGVILPKRRAAALSPVAAKVAAGAVEYVPVARVVNLTICIEELKARNIWVYGLDAAASRSIYEVDMTGPAAVVVGSEGEGLGRLVREHCDVLVRIPMKGHMSSLNASAAAAVALYEVCRQRSGGPKTKMSATHSPSDRASESGIPNSSAHSPNSAASGVIASNAPAPGSSVTYAPPISSSVIYASPISSSVTYVPPPSAPVASDLIPTACETDVPTTLTFTDNAAASSALISTVIHAPSSSEAIDAAIPIKSEEADVSE
ncbi:MAG: 23S rRNA (guanosine(2251)-2'-O)-methyltransferase RlmB [Clostridiales bacterium]|nr:23S rRNA (guanosine(2251)-2'-O)-methyltransferase RlmB [Clostridiales bacterium]